MQLALEQLRRSAQATEGIADFMGQLADDATTDSVLGKQGVFPIQLIALCNIKQLHEDRLLRSLAGKAHSGRQDKVEVALR